MNKFSLFLESWTYSVLWNSLKPKPKSFSQPVHVFFCLADHFEPLWNNVSSKEGLKRIERWVREYPNIASKFKDSDGCHPKHTFFFACEEYKPEFLKSLKEICSAGFGEVEMHLHHRNDTSEKLRKKLVYYRDILLNYGFLSRNKKGKAGYAFIHGNWALDNSLPDGDWCGVNNELQILRETGCYADFTLPSAPSPAQTKKINSLYYAIDDPERPKSHNSGVNVEAGKIPSGDLMIIQGPLTLNWQKRKYKIFPKIENGAITGNNLSTPQRIDLWVKQRIAVKKKPNWIFIKVYTHGCQEKNMDVLFGEPFLALHNCLQDKYNDGEKFKLHYVTAREMYNIIKAAEAGKEGDPKKWRDYIYQAL